MDNYRTIFNVVIDSKLDESIYKIYCSVGLLQRAVVILAYKIFYVIHTVKRYHLFSAPYINDYEISAKTKQYFNLVTLSA